MDKKEYHLLKNVTIPSGEGTTQIDHIIVSRYGLFILETKNMRGWIFGKERQENWTRQIYKKKIPFQNPLRQNYKHTQSIAELFGVDPKKIHSVIAFIGDSEFKKPMPENVTEGKQFIKYIKSFQEPIFGEYDVIEILERIEERRLKPNFKTHREHVQYVKSLHPSSRGKREINSSGPIKGFLGILLIKLGSVVLFLLIIYLLFINFADISYKMIREAMNIPSQRTESSSVGALSRADHPENLKRNIVEPQQGIEKNNSVETMYQYEIKLFSGGVIYTDNAKIVGDDVTYTGRNGLIISINKAEIQSMKRIKL